MKLPLAVPAEQSNRSKDGWCWSHIQLAFMYPCLHVSWQRIYVALHYRLGIVADRIELDWDAENTKHLAAHKVTRSEFEQVMRNSPIDLVFEVVGGEERYRSAGMTDAGRLLVIVWTLRDGKVRAVTAFPASVTYRKLFLEKWR